MLKHFDWDVQCCFEVISADYEENHTFLKTEEVHGQKRNKKKFFLNFEIYRKLQK